MDMDIYTKEDSRGARMKWARKHVVWTDKDGKQQVGMTQDQLGLRLRTQGTMTGVRKIYVSQMENNHNQPSLGMLRKFAEVTGVTIGFLEMETDYPYSTKGREPTYYSPTAAEAAWLIDAAPADERPRILSVVRAMVGHATPVEQPLPQPQQYQEPPLPERNEFARKLVESESAPMFGRLIRA